MCPVVLSTGVGSYDTACTGVFQVVSPRAVSGGVVAKHPRVLLERLPCIPRHPAVLAAEYRCGPPLQPLGGELRRSAGGERRPSSRGARGGVAVSVIQRLRGRRPLRRRRVRGPGGARGRAGGGGLARRPPFTIVVGLALDPVVRRRRGRGFSSQTGWVQWQGD